MALISPQLIIRSWLLCWHLIPQNTKTHTPAPPPHPFYCFKYDPHHPANVPQTPPPPSPPTPKRRRTYINPTCPPKVISIGGRRPLSMSHPHLQMSSPRTRTTLERAGHQLLSEHVYALWPSFSLPVHFLVPSPTILLCNCFLHMGRECSAHSWKIPSICCEHWVHRILYVNDLCGTILFMDHQTHHACCNVQSHGRMVLHHFESLLWSSEGNEGKFWVPLKVVFEIHETVAPSADHKTKAPHKDLFFISPGFCDPRLPERWTSSR